MNEKAQRTGQSSNQFEEVNYRGSTSPTKRVTSEDTNSLTVESTTEAKVLLTTEESTIWLLESDAPHASILVTVEKLYN